MKFYSAAALSMFLPHLSSVSLRFGWKEATSLTQSWFSCLKEGSVSPPASEMFILMVCEFVNLYDRKEVGYR